jgi:hypothetical protein
MVDTLYHNFLYVMGFPVTPEEMNGGKLHITDMLQLQKQRFPKSWWTVAILSLVLSVCWVLFEVWLLLHVIGIKPFGVPREDK